MKDDMFSQMPDSGKGRIRSLLSKLNEDEEKLNNNPLYKEGFEDGYEQGKRDAERRAQHIISGIVRMYDES
jgi:hypothetical protein